MRGIKGTFAELKNYCDNFWRNILNFDERRFVRIPLYCHEILTTQKIT